MRLRRERKIEWTGAALDPAFPIVTEAVALEADELVALSATSAISPVDDRSMPQPSRRIDDQDLLAFTASLLDKKYELYGWCETKIATLVTLNSIMSAAVFIVLEKIFPTHSLTNKILAGTTLLAILLSLAISLYHIEPKMWSGRTDRRNPRTVIGTEAYRDDDEFFRDLSTLTIRRIAELNAKQAFGMNHNIWKNQNAIRAAASFAFIGVLSFVILSVKVYLWQ